MSRLSLRQRNAVIGDVVVLSLLTLAGFATHLTLDAFGRMTATLVGSLVAWVAVAPVVGAYREEVLTDVRSLWRPGWAAFLAAPLATFLRGVLLDRDIPWVFVLVTMATSVFAIVLWRIVYGWWMARHSPSGARSTSSPK